MKNAFGSHYASPLMVKYQGKFRAATRLRE